MADAAEAIARAAADAAGPFDTQVIVKPENVITVPAAKTASPKKKSERGCPEDWKTTWVTFNNPPEVHAMLLKVAKKRGTNVDPMLSAILAEWLKANKVQLEAEAAEWDAAHPAKGPRQKPMTEMSEAELEAFMASLQKQIADVQALADIKRTEAGTAAAVVAE
jgi:hypothetical protein